MKIFYRALHLHTDAERIYKLTSMEGVPHFHSWLVPRSRTVGERGLKFLARDDSCSDEQAAELAGRLREVLIS